MNLFENSRQAVDAVRNYTVQNPSDRATWRDGRGETLWGVTAAEGPFDAYFAHSLPSHTVSLRSQNSPTAPATPH